MNKKDFKRYMHQGLGRCMLTLQRESDIEKYKEIVLWGCLHDLSFDWQCEGTRAAYIYELTAVFDDEEYFVLPTINAFEAVPCRADRLFAHLCELLRRFAENGNERAKIALCTKYDQLFSTLLKKRKGNRYDFERDCFERLCMAVRYLDGVESLFKIAGDMGKLFKENPRYSGADFDRFCSCMDDEIGQKRLLSLLRRASKKSDNMRSFYEQYQKTIEAFHGIRASIEVPTAQEMKYEVVASGTLSPSSRIRFSRRADEAEMRKLAQDAINEPDPFQKSELLSVFAFRDVNFPLSHETVIEYSRSHNDRLQEVAFDVLTCCQSTAVQAYAMELLRRGEHTSQALQMLLCNYTPEDKELLLSELYKIKVDYKEKSDWHSIGLKILTVRDRNVKLPKEFFLYIYNTTLCSYCRAEALRALTKRKWLTKEIIEECRYDSNYEISDYVNRYYAAK